MQLSKSQRFLQEYNGWNEKIQKITDPNIQNEMKKLLNQLVSEVKSIDRQHEDLILTNQLPTAVKDYQSNLTEIRKKIHQKITELENASLIK